MTCRYLLSVGLGLWAVSARAADPVVVELPEQATARTVLVAVGDVGRVSGGDAATRARVARLDLAEFKSRDGSLTVSRRAVEFRLRLAGISQAAFRVTGAEQTTVSVVRRAVTPDEVVAAARQELLRHLGQGAVAVELVNPVAVKLPEVPAGEPVAIAARPHTRVAGPGRVQMDVSVSCSGETLLALAVTFEVKAVAAVVPAGGVVPPGPVVPAGGTARPAAQGEVVIRARERVKIRVVNGPLTVTAVGEAQQDGRMGQNILVQNIDSKKSLTARVTGPGVVDVELGGGP